MYVERNPGRVHEPVALEKIMPYIQPAYWDGHSPGDEETPGARHISQPTADGAKLAVKVLRDYLGRPGLDRTPIEVIQSGETFDPSQYELGTVVAMGREYLMHYSPEDKPLPELRPNPLHFRYPSPMLPRSKWLKPLYETSLYNNDYNIKYWRTAHWGVVDQRHELVVLPLKWDFYYPGGNPAKGVIKGNFREAAPQVVRQTYSSVHNNCLQLTRITAFEVCTNGTPEAAAAANPIRALLQRLGIAPA